VTTVSAGRSPSSLVAALFQPLRRRVQRAVNRQFNRRHYDATRTIEAFASASLWLRPSATR
jgi:hypothetical protein